MKVLSVELLVAGVMVLTAHAESIGELPSDFLADMSARDVAKTFLAQAVQAGERTIPPDSLPTLVREFKRRADSMLQAIWRPGSMDLQHLRLYPAESPHRTADMALVTYEVEGRKVLLAQTGGINAQLWLLVLQNGQETSADAKLAADQAQEFLHRIFNDRWWTILPKLELVRMADGFLARQGSDFQPGRETPICCWLGKQLFCVQVSSRLFQETEPGWAPFGDAWFNSHSNPPVVSPATVNPPIPAISGYMERRNQRRNLRLHPRPSFENPLAP